MRASPGRGDRFMSYCLQPDPPLADEIRGVAREQLDKARLELSRATAEEEAAAVHATRKHIKKIRALLRLVRAEIGGAIFRGENRRLRDVARSLAGARDARVQLQVVEKLRAEADLEGTAFTRTTATLKQEIAALKNHLGPERRAAETILQQIGDRLEGWPLEDLKVKDLCTALRQTYRRGRKCRRKLGAASDPESFHEWRKRVKDLRSQLRLLQNLDPPMFCKMAEDAGTLSRQLGELHDLAFLRARLESGEDFDEAERAVLLGLLCLREGALETSALEFGARFFAEKPGALKQRLRRATRAWAAASGAAVRADA